MKLLIWGAIAIGILFITGLGVFSWVKEQPMYQPGQAAKLDLEPAGGSGSEHWNLAQDIEISHFATGAGRNILYVHGGPGIPPRTSAPALDGLADEFQVHYYDQRGTGRSTRPFADSNWTGGAWQNIQALEGTLGIAQQLADIERVRRILGEEKLVLVGHSYGGLLASLYAAEFPDNVEKLVLLAPANLLVFPSPHGDLYSSVRERLPDSEHQTYDAWLDEYLDLGSIFEKSTDELEVLDGRFLEYFTRASGSVPEESGASIGVWHARAQYYGLGQKHDWREAISAYKGPALVVHGENDLQTIDASRLYADALNGAQIVTIPQAGHFLHYTHSGEVTQVIQRFLTKR